MTLDLWTKSMTTGTRGLYRPVAKSLHPAKRSTWAFRLWAWIRNRRAGVRIRPPFERIHCGRNVREVHDLVRRARGYVHA